MITYQYEYINSNALKNYLIDLNLSKKNQYLFQIFSNKNSEDFQSIYSQITQQVSTAHVIGAMTHELIYNGKVYHDKTIIVISIFERVHFHLISQNHECFSEVNIPPLIYAQAENPSYIQILSTLSVSQNHLLLDTLNDVLPNATLGGGILKTDQTGHDDICLFNNGAFFKHGYIGVIFHSPSYRNY
jgi:small ligand-binding sensory domain FIST